MLAATSESAKKTPEVFVRLGQPVPFIDGQCYADADPDDAKSDFEPGRPSGQEEQFGDADDNAAEIDDTANDNDAPAFLFWGIGAEQPERDFDADAEAGDNNASDDGDSGYDNIPLRQQEEG